MKERNLPPVLEATLAWHQAKRLGLSEWVVVAIRAEAERAAEQWERDRSAERAAEQWERDRSAELSLQWQPKQRTLWELGR